MICRQCRAELPATASYCHCCAFTGPAFRWAAAASDDVAYGELPPAAARERSAA